MTFNEQDRVWLRAYSCSKAKKSFKATLTPKCLGSYCGIQQVGPLNCEVVLEENGEDIQVAHISCLRPCYPMAQHLDDQQRQRLREIFETEWEEEDFEGDVLIALWTLLSKHRE